MSARGEPAESETALAQDSLLTVIREHVDGMLVIAGDGVILLANPAAERLLGRPSTRLTGTRFEAPLVLDQATEFDVEAGGSSRTVELRVVGINWRGRPAYLASLRDMTERKLSETVLARVGRQHAAIAQLGTDAVSGLSPDSLMAGAAKQVRRVLATDFAGVLAVGLDGQALPLERSELRLVASEWSVPVFGTSIGAPGRRSQARHTLEGNELVVTDGTENATRFAAWPPGLASMVTVLIGDGEHRFGVLEAGSRSARQFNGDELTFLQSVANLLAAALARLRVERQVRHQALHDPLTGLPNRALFVDRVDHALARFRRRRTGLAVLFADLDGFKQVNDTLGHPAGDQVLINLSRRLANVLRSTDSLARFGGDEFVLLLEDVASDDELAHAVDRVRAAVTDTPFVIDGRPHRLDLTIGVVRADASHRTPDDLIRDADAAMYRAKELGRGGYAVFDRDMREHATGLRRVEQELRAAIDAGQLVLVYQPIVSLDSGRVVELEALLRWQHPTRGLLAPADFLDVAVESRLIVPIGQWALAEACHQAAAWRMGVRDADAPTVNVNMAPSELAQPELQETVKAALRQGGVDLTLQLELTEGALITDSSLPATLRELNDTLGVRAALDDFGTGYSSLACLTRFKVDELKIDRSFISPLTAGRDAPIVAAIANMAHALDILVVAEGIETEEQALAARRLNCDRGQGYFFSPPLTSDEIPKLLAAPTGLPAPVAPS